MDFKNIIQDKMKKDNLTAYKLSKLSGVAESQLSLFFRGKRTLTIPALQKLMNVLKLAIDEKCFNCPYKDKKNKNLNI